MTTLQAVKKAIQEKVSRITLKLRILLEPLLHKIIGGHISIGRLTIYGRNAMHFAINYRRKDGNYVCFRLPLFCFGKWWSVYFYISPDATPTRATYTLGCSD